MTVRNYAILYVGGKRTRGGTVVGGGTIVEGGNGVLDTEPHALDGGEHSAAADLTRLNASTTAHGLLPKLSGDSSDALRGDGTWVSTIPAETIVGTVTPDGAAKVTVSSGTDHRAFPGVAWLDTPTATTHGAGDRFLIVYRKATDHLAGGKIVGKIGTVTETTDWTYTLGSEFDILDTAIDLRVEDSISILDIDGSGDYRAVIAFREFTGGLSGVNQAPGVLVSDVASGSVTSSTTWTRYNIALSGHTQDWVVGRVHKLQNDRFMVAFGHISGSTHTNGVAWVTDITDWSAPTFVNISAGATIRDEINFEEMPDGTLHAHLRNDTTTDCDSSTSTDSGDTWSAPVEILESQGWPSWRLLTSGIAFTVTASDATYLTAYWQTVTGSSDTGWGSSTLLDSTAGYHSSYATILQLDNYNVLIVYAIEEDGAVPVDSDIYSVIFTDSTVFGGGASGVQVSVGDTTPGYLEDKVAAGAGITLTKLNPGGNEEIEISLTQGAGHYEVIVSGTSPPVAVTTPDGTDWVYGWVSD